MKKLFLKKVTIITKNRQKTQKKIKTCFYNSIGQKMYFCGKNTVNRIDDTEKIVYTAYVSGKGVCFCNIKQRFKRQE